MTFKINMFRRAVYFSSLVHLLTTYDVIKNQSDTSVFPVPPEETTFYILRYVDLSSILGGLENVYYLSLILLTMAIIIGYSSRFLSLLVCFLVLYVEKAIFPVLDGGNNINHIMLLYLIIPNEKSTSYISEALKKYFVILASIQMSLLYFSAGVFKVISPMWQNGTALYYVLTSYEYSHPLVAEAVWSLSPKWFVLPTYLVMVFQISYPLAMYHKRIKLYYLAFGVLFHVFIGLAMGLPTFAIHMCAIYVIFLDDSEIVKKNQRSCPARHINTSNTNL
jgi:hypothetical protein